MPRHRRFAKTLLAGWLVAAIVPVALLMVGHLLTLPVPVAVTVAAAIRASRRPSEEGRWLAVHALYGKCACSTRVLDHLVARGARRDVAERVLLVDSDPALEGKLGAAGYAVERLSARDLKGQYGVESVPLLVIVSPDGALRYMGGYTTQKQGPDIRDVALIDAATHGDTDAPLPLFGCAVSRELQRTLDPLGLKY